MKLETEASGAQKKNFFNFLAFVLIWLSFLMAEVVPCCINDAGPYKNLSFCPLMARCLKTPVMKAIGGNDPYVSRVN